MLFSPRLLQIGCELLKIIKIFQVLTKNIDKLPSFYPFFKKNCILLTAFGLMFRMCKTLWNTNYL